MSRNQNPGGSVFTLISVNFIYVADNANCRLNLSVHKLKITLNQALQKSKELNL